LCTFEELRWLLPCHL